MRDAVGDDDHVPAIRGAHWATVVLIGAAYGLAWSLQGASSREQATWLLMLHRSAGVTILLLTIIRLGFRFRTTLPSLPDDLPRWQRLAAKSSEAGLYIGLFGQPILGIVGSVMRGNAILFGLPVPALIAPNRQLAREILGLHGIFSWCLLALIVLHAFAAMQHHFVRGDDVLVRMLPMLRRLRQWRIAGVRPQ